MGAVLKLIPKDNAATVRVLEWMLSEARAGRLDDLAGCFRRNGVEEAVFTGAYEAHPDKALSAAMRLSWRLTQMQGERP